MHIAHVALWTCDIERAASFWADYFGAQVGERYESSRRPGFASRFLALDSGATIELMTAPWLPSPKDMDEDRPGWAHIAIATGSELRVCELAERFRSQDLLVAAPRRTGDGFFEAVVRDYDGNLIEITG